MKRALYILAAFYFLCSCSSDESRNPVKTVQKVAEEYFPKAIDTSSFIGKNKSFDEFSTGNYKPIYLGDKQSTLFVDYWIQKYTKDPNLIKPLSYQVSEYDSISEEYWNKYKSYFPLHNSVDLLNWDSADIRIHIDTSCVIRNIELKDWNTDTIIYNAYPVILVNKMDSDVIVGHGFQIPLIIEVANEENNWVPIEIVYSHLCANGLRSVILPKNEIIITSLPISKGISKTKMRLKLGRNYSNEIWGDLTIKNLNAR
jgi:hypothetical protein